MMTGGARRPRRSAAETRAEILARAGDLFRDQGFAKTSIADIAASLGMSPANVFKHFPSKTALAEAITVLHLDLIRAGIEAIPASAPAPKRLRLFAETLLASHLRNMEGSPYVFDLIVLSMESETEGTHAFHAWLVGALRAIVEAGMAEGCFAAGDPDRIARVLLVCIEGATHPLLIAHRDREGLSGRLGEVMAFLTASLRIAC